MDYVIAVQTPAYKFSATSFAVDSVFALHLVALRDKAGDSVARVVLVAPQMSHKDYLSQRHHMTVLNAGTDEIFFVAAYSLPLSGWRFWLQALPLLVVRMWRLMPRAVVVHSGMSFDIRWPTLAWVNIIAWLRRRPILFVLDIDFRRDARRYRQLGEWSSFKYLVNATVLDPFRWAQVWAAPKMCGLVLLKGDALVNDFGHGRPHVKNFHDTVHSAEQVLSGPALMRRLDWLRDADRPMTLCYFGRLVWKKGLDRTIYALHLLRQQGHDVHLKIIGDGHSHDILLLQIDSLSLRPYVQIHNQVEYGEQLFELLDATHLCVATPLVEDTPRSAFDAFARALPLVAFDTEYFRDLANASNAVALADWPKPEALAEKIVELVRDRERLAQMAERGVRFAESNTQEIWLQRRATWTQQFLLREGIAWPTPDDGTAGAV
jgi:glycosyltransferase involved in cell wall biosynthesis